MSISSMARIFSISKSTVIRKIQQAADTISKPVISECGQEYEMDEMHTFIGRNLPGNYRYIIYAINKRTSQVIDFIVGRRTKEDLAHVVKSVLELNPRKIFTDKLNIYPTLIGKPLHNTDTYKINYIERMNLSLRTHLKRLSRKTICYSKSAVVLSACLKIYFWY